MVAVVLVASLPMAACPSSGPATEPTSWSQPASFEALVRLTADRSEQRRVLMDEHRFTLRLETQPVPRAVAGTFGTVVSLPLLQQSGTWRIDGPLRLASGETAAPCQPITHTYRYEELELRPAAPAAEPGTDLVGTVMGRAERVEGDALVSATFSGELLASLDRSPPRLLLNQLEGPRHPLDGVVVRASEPLPARTELALHADGQNAVPLDASPNDGERALWKGVRLMGFGRRYQVAPSEPLFDLAGNPADPTEWPTFETIADPGVLAEDGFEAELNALVQAPAALVSEGELPPLAGQRSLLLPPARAFRAEGRFTARLAVTPGDGVVHVLIRMVARGPMIGSYVGRIRLAAPGHPPTEHDPFSGPVGPPAVLEIPDAGLWLSAPITLRLPLPPGTTDEVVLDIAPLVVCGLAGRSSGLLLDEIRVEPWHGLAD